jgi:hypothetical protein
MNVPIDIDGSSCPSVEPMLSNNIEAHWDPTTSDTGVMDSVVTTTLQERHGFYRCTLMMAPS